MLLSFQPRAASLAIQQAAAPYARRIGLLVTLVALGIALAWLPVPLATTALLGCITLALIMLRPAWGLPVLVVLIPFSLLVSLSVGGVSVGGMEALLGLMLAGWLLRMAAHRQVVIPHPPLLIPWLLWLGAILVSWLGALSLGAAVTETAKWVEMLALYLFIAANLERRHLPWLAGAMLLAGAAQAALGLYQFLFAAGPEGFLLFGGRFLRAYGTFRQPNPYAGYLGLVLPLAYSLALWGLARRPQTADGRSPLAPSPPGTRPFPIEPSGLREPSLRALGMQGQSGRPAPAARTCGGAGVGQVCGAAGAGQPPASGPHASRITFYVLRFTFYALLGLLLVALYASQSRGAWIGLAAAIVGISLMRGGRTAILFGLLISISALLIAVGGLQILPPTLLQRFSEAAGALWIPDIAIAQVTDANFAAVERLAHWQAALAMWRDHLWLGVGFGNYAAVYPAYAVGRWLDPLGHAHNTYLNVAAETGLLGLLAYSLFWLSAFSLAWRAVRRARGFHQALAVGGLGILIHLSTHNLVDNLFVQGMYLHVGVVLGLLSWIYRNTPPGES
jgi:hypothetical protein